MTDLTVGPQGGETFHERPVILLDREQFVARGRPAREADRDDPVPAVQVDTLTHHRLRSFELFRGTGPYYQWLGERGPAA